jgi:hypothetical protein
VGIKNTFKPTIGNERLYQDTNNNGVGMVNLATKILGVRARCSSTENFISKPGPDGKTQKQIITY